ncbi:MAG: hypothetical protein IT327_23470 [Anaerolineae bacterium]|nr:hypothetical protein [Anaerolineae bacterium]
MMKTVGRILAILLAVTAVAGATYALGQTSWFASQVASRGGDRGGFERPEGEEFGELAGPGFGQDGRPERPEFGDGRGRDGADGFNLFALAAFARTLVPIALVTTAVVLFTKLADGWRKRGKTAVAAPGEPLNQA